MLMHEKTCVIPILMIGCRRILTCSKRLKLSYTKVMQSQLMQFVFNLCVYMLYVPIYVFSVMWGRFSVFLYLNSTKKQIK